ncbi:MAG: 2-amino-4-hydroxy-6-hydroxymethyldihydropteridine diphosphokinase [Polyangiaceae bacterium]
MRRSDERVDDINGPGGHSLDCVIGLGANLGEPRDTLAAAVRALADLGRISGVSALYHTAPVGGPSQPDFLNAAVRLEYFGEPLALLEALLAIERGFGRERRERWGPRVLDLDLLWIDGVQVRTATLEVPHPRLVERTFALDPLLDVCPAATDPHTGRPYRSVRAELSDDGIQRLEQVWVSGH